MMGRVKQGRGRKWRTGIKWEGSRLSSLNSWTKCFIHTLLTTVLYYYAGNSMANISLEKHENDNFFQIALACNTSCEYSSSLGALNINTEIQQQLYNIQYPEMRR